MCSDARHTSRFLTLWCLSLPISLVESMGLLVIPVAAFVTWCLFGIQEIGLFIEHCALDDGAIFMDSIAERAALDVRETFAEEDPLSLSSTMADEWAEDVAEDEVEQEIEIKQEIEIEGKDEIELIANVRGAPRARNGGSLYNPLDIHDGRVGMQPLPPDAVISWPTESLTTPAEARSSLEEAQTVRRKP